MVGSKLAGCVRQHHCISQLNILLIAHRIQVVFLGKGIQPRSLQCPIYADVCVADNGADLIGSAIVHRPLQFSRCAPLSFLNVKNLGIVKQAPLDPKQFSGLPVSDSVSQSTEIAVLIIVGQRADSRHVILHPQPQHIIGGIAPGFCHSLIPAIRFLWIVGHANRLHRHIDQLLSPPQRQCQLVCAKGVHLLDQFFLLLNGFPVDRHDVIPGKHQIFRGFPVYAVRRLHRAASQNQYALCCTVDSHNPARRISFCALHNRHFHFFDRQDAKQVAHHLMLSHSKGVTVGFLLRGQYLSHNRLGSIYHLQFHRKHRVQLQVISFLQIDMIRNGR